MEFLLPALFLGIKHSFDADHLVGVSNLLTMAKGLKGAAKLAISWAVGHMLTAVLITIVLFSMKESFLPQILDKLELLAGAMLIFLGALSLNKARVFHSHRHAHDGKGHAHPHLHVPQNSSDHIHSHMFGVGIVHGLASNDELLLLLTVTLGLASLPEMIFGVAVFSFGVVLGMIAFSMLFTFPIVKLRSKLAMRLLNVLVGGVSVGYGASMLLA